MLLFTSFWPTLACTTPGLVLCHMWKWEGGIRRPQALEGGWSQGRRVGYCGHLISTVFGIGRCGRRSHQPVARIEKCVGRRQRRLVGVIFAWGETIEGFTPAESNEGVGRLW